MASGVKKLCIKLYGNYLIFIYCIIKLLYIGNAILQILALNKFLGDGYHMYGIDVLRNMIAGKSWSTSDRFPRVTLCDIHIRRMGNIHNYTVQCSLPLNLFNEITYISIWFWLVIVALVTTCSLIQWIYLSAFLSMQGRYVTSRLIAMGKLTDDDDDCSLDKFVPVFLHRDGLFIIRLIAKNCSDIIATTIICDLYDHFKGHMNQLKLSKLDIYRIEKAKLRKEYRNDVCKSLSVEAEHLDS